MKGIAGGGFAAKEGRGLAALRENGMQGSEHQ